jgi:hypothetical protein
MRQVTYLGSVDSWDAAFDVADRLLVDEGLDSVATLSPKEYERGGWFATLLGEMGFEPQVALRLLRQVAPGVHPGNNCFQLYKGELLVGDTALKVLAIVYSTQST